MSFASPIWLAVLLPPWAVVAVWLMWSRRGQRTEVPFLALWGTGAAEPPRDRRLLRPPPLALIAALIGALLAILASARPRMLLSSTDPGPHMTLVVDCGVTMSTANRRQEVLDRARRYLEALGRGPATLVAVPDAKPREMDRSAWLDAAAVLASSPQYTADALRAVVQQALARSPGLVVVLSDQPVADDPRVIQIAPAAQLRNAGIVHFAVRESRGAQAMVTVENFTAARSSAMLRVRSGERREVERAIELPMAGDRQTYFIDLPPLGSSAVVELELDDDIAVDNVAHASRQHAFPAIEIRSPVPPEVRRVAEAYARARAASEASVRIALVTDAAIPGDVPVAIVSQEAPADDAGPVRVAAHPVSAGVDWAAAEPRAAGAPPGTGWRAVVSVGDQPAVAIRETAHRQVWIGLDAVDFPRSAEFVVFWTNVFDWLAGGEDRGKGSGGPSVHWTSRVVSPVSIAPLPQMDWQAKLVPLQAQQRRSSEMTEVFLLASVICLMLAAVGWPRRSLTRFSTPLNV